MYNISYFKENERNQILDFIRKYPFAFLTGSTSEGKQVATQIPFLLEERNGELFLQAHVMKNTDHHRAFIENPNALIVFSGPHTYVSATWYTTKNIGSTWNYMSVHAEGNIRFMSEEELVEFMKKLTLRFEGENEHSPTYYDNLSESYLDKMMRAIVGIEIKVERLDNVFKLSQNRDEESYRTIISELEQQDGDSLLIAEEMKKRLGDLF